MQKYIFYLIPPNFFCFLSHKQPFSPTKIIQKPKKISGFTSPKNIEKREFF